MDLYRILDKAFIYNISQKILAPGDKGQMKDLLNDAIRPYRYSAVLELGAGTGAYSPKDFTNCSVTDINHAYLKNGKSGSMPVCCDATKPAFKPDTFDLVFSMGLSHHLSDMEYRHLLNSVTTILKKNGVFMVLDNIWPTNKINPIAYLIRRFDRGKYIRTASQQEKILSGYFATVSSKTGCYSYYRLEYSFFICSNQK